jgi:hypothetical protein
VPPAAHVFDKKTSLSRPTENFCYRVRARESGKKVRKKCAKLTKLMPKFRVRKSALTIGKLRIYNQTKRLHVTSNVVCRRISKKTIKYLTYARRTARVH